jgi:hypothetical protein
MGQRKITLRQQNDVIVRSKSYIRYDDQYPLSATSLARSSRIINIEMVGDM